MTYIARLLRLISVVVWVGGLIFFAFVEAPAAFHVMGTNLQFAQLINHSITSVNELGHAVGVLFIIGSLLLWQLVDPRTRRLLLAEIGFILLMFAATMYVQRGIVPAMERDRAAVGGDINSVPTSNPVRAHFDRLHATSEKVEGAALFFGLGVLLLMAAESPGTRARASHPA